MSDYRGNFLYKSVGNDILVRLERVLDYAGIRLERFDCILQLGAETYSHFLT